MVEKLAAFSSKKLTELGIKLPQSSNGLFFGDEPQLHRLVKARLSKAIRSREEAPLLTALYTAATETDGGLSQPTFSYLSEEAELQQVDFLIQDERLNRTVLDAIIRNISHLDFRSFSDSQHTEFSLYDPEVITPQVSWAVTQIFNNFPGFVKALADMAEQDEVIGDHQSDIIRNVFILGYFHGFLAPTSQNIVTTKEYLAYFIRQSRVTDDSLKEYPEFLRRLVDVDQSSQVSPRLASLKDFWHQQFVRYWLMVARTDEVSEEVFTQDTLQQVGPTLSTDQRPAENLAVAARMDLFAQMKLAWEGYPASGVETGASQSTQNQQARAEWQLTMDIKQLQDQTVAHLRGTLQLYQNHNQEVFQTDSQVADKWLPYQKVAPRVLQKLTQGFTALEESSGDMSRFNAAVTEIVAAMIAEVAVVSPDTTTAMRELFGADFFNIAAIEQLSLLAFTALSLLSRGEDVVALAIQVLDRHIIPQLRAHSDIDPATKLFANQPPAFLCGMFDKEACTIKSQQAKSALHTMELTDGLLSIDNPTFLKLLKDKKQSLAGVSKLYSAFAALVGENWGETAPLKTTILGWFTIMVAFISGSINFNLAQSLLDSSLGDLYAEDPNILVLKLLPIVLTTLTGALYMGSRAKKDFKGLSLASPTFSKEIKKFFKGGWRQVALLFFVGAYALGSTFPLWENQAEKWWEYIEDRWEELQKDDQTVSMTSEAETFWENRNPEAADPKDLEKIEKAEWGQLVIGSEVYGRDSRTPIGFLNTFVVSPVNPSLSTQDFETQPGIYENIGWAGDEGIMVDAQSCRVSTDQIQCTLTNGETFIQEAAGVDFVILDGVQGTPYGFSRFLDTGRYIDKIIVLSPPQNASSLDSLFVPGRAFSYYNSTDFYTLTQPDFKYFVVYKTAAEAENKMRRVVNLETNFAFWQAYSQERRLIQEILQKENPEAAALYTSMMAEQTLYWDNYDPTETQDIAGYLDMLERQVTAYRTFVQTNHVYSLKYHPRTEYAQQYPKVGVLLDVMALDQGGYYCLTAHLAAQEWFLSLGVPMDGLYGYHLYDDGGQAKSRIGHVQTGLYGAVYDFTPAIPNPGEDLQALAFDPSQPVGEHQAVVMTPKDRVVEMLRGAVSADNLGLLALLLSTMAVGYGVKQGISQLRRKPTEDEEVELIQNVLPDDELAKKSLAYALLHLINALATLDQQSSVDSESGQTVVAQDHQQLLREVLVLASQPLSPEAAMIDSIHLHPQVLAVLEQLGLERQEPQRTTTSANLLELAPMVNQPRAQAVLSELRHSLKSVAASFEQAYSADYKTTQKRVRQLQKQLHRIRQKSNRLYGGYGTLLEKLPLNASQGVAKERRRLTADYTAVNQALVAATEELATLQKQKKILPTNVRNLRKVLDFILRSEGN